MVALVQSNIECNKGLFRFMTLQTNTYITLAAKQQKQQKP